MKVIDFPKLIQHYEAKTQKDFVLTDNYILIEMEPVRGSYKEIMKVVRNLNIEIRYKGFRIKNIKEMYCRIDASNSITIGEMEELQNYLGLGFKKEVSFYIHPNENLEQGRFCFSFAFEYEKSKYEKEILSKKMIQFIEKRNDCLILYEMFKDEKYIKKAKKIMRSLKKMERVNKK